MRLPLETRELGRRYSGQWALRDCTLEVEAGSVTALVGPNGAGKTTLLRLAAGLLAPTVGEVRVFGHIPASSPAALACVGYLSQEHPLYRCFTVAELLHMGRAMNSRWDQSFAEEKLTALGIPGSRRAGALSAGQQSQVAITLALAKRPDLLLLDEPVASLDPLARHDLMSMVLADSADRGTTVVVSSHVVAELERFCDRLLVLGAGQVQIDGAVDDLLARHAALTGPAEAASPVGVRHVLARVDDVRSTTLVVETSGAIQDPRWQQRALSLEEVVLAYLRVPDAATRDTKLRVAGRTS